MLNFLKVIKNKSIIDQDITIKEYQKFIKNLYEE